MHWIQSMQIKCYSLHTVHCDKIYTIIIISQVKSV